MKSTSVKSKTAGSARTLFAAMVICLIAAAGVAPHVEAGSRQPTLLWKFPVGYWVYGLGVGPDGTIYAAPAGEKEIYALVPNGTLRRKFASETDIRAMAVGNDGTVYVGGSYLCAFTPDGALKWKIPVHVQFWGLAVGSDGTLYVSTGNSLTYPETRNATFANIYAFAPDGKVRWKLNAAQTVGKVVLGNEGTAYVAVIMLSPTASVRFYTIDPRGVLGRPLSSHVGGGAMAVGRDGVVYSGECATKGVRDPRTGCFRPVGRQLAQVCAIEPHTGSVSWSFGKVRGAVFAVVKRHDVYVGSYDGHVYALDPKTGALRWKYWTGAGWGKMPVHALAVGNDGTIYAGAGSFVEAIRPP